MKNWTYKQNSAKGYQPVHKF